MGERGSRWGEVTLGGNLGKKIPVFFGSHVSIEILEWTEHYFNPTLTPFGLRFQDPFDVYHLTLSESHHLFSVVHSYNHSYRLLIGCHLRVTLNRFSAPIWTHLTWRVKFQNPIWHCVVLLWPLLILLSLSEVRGQRGCGLISETI